MTVAIYIPEWAREEIAKKPKPLAPGETIRVEIRVPLEMEPGEYRGSFVLMEDGKTLLFRREE